MFKNAVQPQWKDTLASDEGAEQEKQNRDLCIDLRPICTQNRWKWHYEESYSAEHMSPKNPDAPWYVEILCQYGVIYPCGGDHLLVSIEGHPRLPSKLESLGPAVRRHQGNVVYRFPAELLDAVAGILKPRRKKKATPGAIERCRAGLERWRERTGESQMINSESSKAPEPSPDYANSKQTDFSIDKGENSNE